MARKPLVPLLALAMIVLLLPLPGAQGQANTVVDALGVVSLVGGVADSSLAHAYTLCAPGDAVTALEWSVDAATDLGYAVSTVPGDLVLDEGSVPLEPGVGSLPLGLDAAAGIVKVAYSLATSAGVLLERSSFVHLACTLLAPAGSQAALAGTQPLTMGEAALVKCEPDLGNLLSMPEGDANTDGRHAVLCRALNGELGLCEENGDCECGSQPFAIGGTDTDRDGVSNTDDVDDDCDHLTDSLETSTGFSTTSAMNVLDMNPRGVNMKLRVGLNSLSGVADFDDFKTANADPYLSEIILSYTAPQAEDVTFSLPKFKKTDHPTNIGSSYTVPSHATWGSWSQAAFNVKVLPDDISDLEYTWRSASTNAITGLPQFQLRFTLWDEDVLGSEKMIDVNTGELEPLNLLQLARLVNGAFLPRALAYGVPGTAMTSVHVGVEASPCAVAWAYEAFINDRYAIDAGTGIVPSSASISTC